jgi:hypothetical protein
VDGAKQGTYVTGTQIAAATFPDAELMTPMIALKNAHADDFTATMDWWRVAQMRQKI